MKSELLNDLIKELTGMDCNQSIETRTCAFCSATVTDFRDELSEKEFLISGLCQACQDSVWGEPQ